MVSQCCSQYAIHLLKAVAYTCTHTSQHTHAASNEYKRTLIHIQSTEQQHMDDQLLLVHHHFPACGDAFLQTCKICFNLPTHTHTCTYTTLTQRLNTAGSPTGGVLQVLHLQSRYSRLLKISDQEMCLIHRCPSSSFISNPLLSLSAPRTHTHTHTNSRTHTQV